MRDRSVAARRAAQTRAMYRACFECGVAPGVRHLPACVGGYVNYSDDRGRYMPPPPPRLARWRDCGPSAEECEGPRPDRAESGGYTG